MLLYLKEEGVKYKPDVVIVGYLSCDDSRNLLSFRDFAKPRYKLKNNKLVLTGSPISPPEKIMKNDMWRLSLVDLWSVARHKIELKSGAYDKREEEMTNAILNEIVSEVKKMGAIPVLAYIDGIRDNQKVVQRLLPDIKKFLKYWKQEQKVPTAFLLPEVDAAKRILYKDELAKGETVYVKRKYGHFSPFENKSIAIGLRNFLLKNGYL